MQLMQTCDKPDTRYQIQILDRDTNTRILSLHAGLKIEGGPAGREDPGGGGLKSAEINGLGLLSCCMCDGWLNGPH